MFKKLRFSILGLGAFVLGLLLLSPLVFGVVFASSLGETSILFERMEIETSNIGARGFVTPTTSFSSGGSLKIHFVGSDLGDWCKAASVPLTVTGIEESLPGSLVGTCHQHANGDYIEITGIGALSSGTKYGFEIAKHTNFSTGPNIGRNRISVELSSGIKNQEKTFSIHLMSNDRVQIVAEVSDADSVVCTISDAEVPLGALYRGGAYVTASHTLGTSTTGGSRGYYWTVFGLGDGLEAGLKSPNYLIRSLNNTVNLLTGEGFGLVVSPNAGSSVPLDFSTALSGVFGSVKSGFDNARMILYRTSEQPDHEEAVVTVAARASEDAEVGEYTETLTYSCGAYIGGYRPLELAVSPTTLDFGTSEETKMFAISNSGTGTLEWEVGETIYVNGADWVVDVDPNAGQSRSSSDNVAVSVTREHLSAGSYEATIPVTSLGGGNKNVTILLEKIASLLKIFTKQPYEIATTSAKSGGDITDDGGSAVTSRGVCYGTTTNPTTPCTTDGSGAGEFVSEMTSLDLGTRYYVRAYGENGEGLVYGDEFNFITLSTISANPENRGWDNTDVEVTITAIGPDIPQIDYCWTVENTCAPDTFVVENPTNVAQTETGEWNLCYRYRDADGKKSNTFCSGLYRIDKTEPVVGGPEIYEGNEHENEWFNGEISVRSSVSAQGGSGLDTDSCEVTFDGGTTWKNSTVGDPNYDAKIAYSVSFCQYNDYTPDDDFTIRFRISDEANNVGTSSLGEFTYDPTAPTTTAIMTTHPEGNAYTCGNWASEIVRVLLSCEDNVGGSGCDEDSPQYCIDEDDSCTPLISYSESIDISTLGTTYFRYFSRDNLGNEETVQSCEINIKDEQELEGYAWSGRFGWISFSCENDDSCSTSDYRVTLKGSELIGYAWSKSYGWISFNCENDDSCSTSNYKVTLSDGSLSGHAWSGQFGWVSFDGVTFNNATGEFHGSALNGIGTIEEDEISFNCTDKGLCATSNYRVNVK